MRFDLNKFWQQRNIFNYLLLPLAGIFFLLTRFNVWFSNPQKVTAKVICVGNITVGGAGKTPLALAIGEMLKKQGYKVAFISRGYKGRLSSKSKVVKVDSLLHTAQEVGDEPLLLANTAPTYICIDRYLAASHATDDGAEIVIMDDGLQNYHLEKDIKILVLDDFFYSGNSFLLPAGPLRSPKLEALKDADFICINQNKVAPDNQLKLGKPVFFITTQVINAHQVSNKQFVVMSGIANPTKLMNTLKELNVTVIDKFFFPDHHCFSEGELQRIIRLAKEHRCKIITTSKDYTRIPASFRKHFIVLSIKKVLPKLLSQKLLSSL
jgi:tetraacyldisaccharide 4'-kinase